jgi:hypothetical protein
MRSSPRKSRHLLVGAKLAFAPDEDYWGLNFYSGRRHKACLCTRL